MTARRNGHRLSVFVYVGVAILVGFVYDVVVPVAFRGASPDAVLYGLVITGATTLTLLTAWDEGWLHLLRQKIRR